jgi:RNA polymerase sigma-70 factor (ECF subfamily)
MSELAGEDDLIEAAVVGNTAAVEHLLWAYYSQLLQHVEQTIPDRARRHFTSEDILQLVFAQAFRDVRRFQPRGDGSFFAWLRTIADHRLIDAVRKLDHGGAQQLSVAQFGDDDSIIDLIDAVCRDSNSPSKYVRKEEAARAIHIAIAGLPEDQRDAIHLNCLEEKSVEEIARITGRTEAAVRGLIHRGKKNLRDAMGRSTQWLTG